MGAGSAMCPACTPTYVSPTEAIASVHRVPAPIRSSTGPAKAASSGTAAKRYRLPVKALGKRASQAALSTHSANANVSVTATGSRRPGR